jgi:hypothetical protein
MMGICASVLSNVLKERHPIMGAAVASTTRSFVIPKTLAELRTSAGIWTNWTSMRKAKEKGRSPRIHTECGDRAVME